MQHSMEFTSYCGIWGIADGPTEIRCSVFESGHCPLHSERIRIVYNGICGLQHLSGGFRKRLAKLLHYHTYAAYTSDCLRVCEVYSFYTQAV